MKNIKVLHTGIDVSKVLEQLKQHPEDWNSLRGIEGAHNLVDEWGFDEISAGILQLIMGVTTDENQFVGDSEYCVQTPYFQNHLEVFKLVGKYYRNLGRCAFLSLPVGGEVGTHIDIGSYYQTRDRYHLSIQGTYAYHVGDEELIIKPGMLVWFNNKLPHGTRNIGNDVRITFVFDVKNSEYEVATL